MAGPEGPRGLYPPRYSSALCLTFDLDGTTMWTSKDAANADRPAVTSLGTYDVREGLDLVLAWLADVGIRTTFFVPTEVAVAHREAISSIVGAGHELGMHGDDHTPLRDRTRAGEGRYLLTLKDTLEQLSGTAVLGYRAPLYDVTGNTRELLAEIGCTFSSNYMDSLYPYVVDSPSGSVVEVPVHWMLDDGPYLLFSNSPPNYRQYMANSQIVEIWEAELRGLQDLGGTAVFTLHPQLVGRPSRLRILDELLAAASDRTVWFPTMSEIAEFVAGRPREQL